MKKRTGGFQSFLNKHSQPVGLEDENKAIENQIIMMDVRDLKPNPDNFYGMRDIESLAAMIDLSGDIEPFKVKLDTDGKYMIISGHRRREAILYLLDHQSVKRQSPLVPVLIKDFQVESQQSEYHLSETEMETVNLIFPNKGQRKNRTPMEESEEIKRLEPIAQKIYKQEKKAGNVSGNFRKFFAEEILGISSSALQRKQALGNLSEEVKSKVQEGKITATAAAELASMDHEKQNEVVQTLQEKDPKSELTVKAIQEAKENLSKLEDEGQTTIFPSKLAHPVDKSETIKESSETVPDKKVMTIHAVMKVQEMLVSKMEHFKKLGEIDLQDGNTEQSLYDQAIVKYIDALILKTKDDLFHLNGVSMSTNWRLDE
jgi:ParB-like chromosome segregation protein Spo0J